jgi:hypothetical protein
MLNVVMLSVDMLSVIYAEYRYAECRGAQWFDFVKKCEQNTLAYSHLSGE